MTGAGFVMEVSQIYFRQIFLKIIFIFSRVILKYDDFIASV